MSRKNPKRRDQRMSVSGVPPRSPNLNPRCERFVKSIKEETLNQMIIFGERSLRYVTNEYIAHYHHERDHQGLDNCLISPSSGVGVADGPVTHRDRLGGLLTYYS